MQVHCVIGYYLSQHPDSHLAPMDAILASFKEGRNEDGLIDSHLPDLSMVMSQIPNTRERWLQERLGIESLSRDLGGPCAFITFNLEVRASSDVRKILHRLEYGENSAWDPDYFEKNTDLHTELMGKYAVQISIYLHLKVKLFMKAFFEDVLGVPETNDEKDWTEQDRTDNGWSFGRVEFNESRGIQHWHTLVKIPGILDLSVLGRVIHNSRVLRQELKCGNIRAGISFHWFCFYHNVLYIRIQRQLSN